MRVLFVSSGNRDKISTFIFEQGNALIKAGIPIDFFLIKGKGLTGYLSNLSLLKRRIKLFNPDIVHAHFGLSGAVASLQFLKPKVVTLHGSDVSSKINNIITSIVSLLADCVITVNEKMPNSLFVKPINEYSVIPCGIGLETFYPFDKFEARTRLGWNVEDKIIVFSSSFTNPVKNYKLAKLAIANLTNDYNKLRLVELHGKNRNEVNDILNAADLLLMTSFSEGSPQIVKEAMACNLPIVSTDVGDVRWVIGDTKGCYVTTFDPVDVVEKIKLALEFSEKIGRIKGRERIIELGLDSETIAKKVIDVYNSVLKKNIK